MNFRHKVVQIIRKNFLAGREYDLHNDQSFIESRIIDSIGMIQLIGLIEEEFSIQIEDEEVLPENLESVNAIVHYLEKKIIEN